MTKRSALLSLLLPTIAWACPNLSGQYHASYTLNGERFEVISTVAQYGCISMKADNVITSSRGVQRYTREWIADGIFRRKDGATAVSATFSSDALITTEVVSLKDPSQLAPQLGFFSRRDRVFLDPNGNLVNSEERFDEQGNRIGSDRFVYQRR
jgi:hypothetical protein